MEFLRRPLRALRDRLDPELRSRRRQHRARNAGLPADALALRDGIVLRVDPRTRDSMEYFLFRSKEMCREFDLFLAGARGRRRLLDVGALHGIFSLAFTRGHGERRAVAVEPSRAARALLSENVKLNSDCSIVISDVALGRVIGETRMRANWQHLEALAPGDDTADSIPVRMETADRLCRDLGFAPDFVKIDVEGFEAEVLAGARSILATKPLLLLELHPPVLTRFGADAGGIVDQLRRDGFEVEWVGGDRWPGRRARRKSALRLVARPI